MLLLPIKDQIDFAYNVESFYNPIIRKVNVVIGGIPHKIFKGSILPWNMYPEICKKFYQKDSDVSFKKYITSKYVLWIETRLSVDNKLHGSGRLVNSVIKLQINKVAEISGNLTCYIFAIQDAYVHLSEGKLEAIDM